MRRLAAFVLLLGLASCEEQCNKTTASPRSRLTSRRVLPTMSGSTRRSVVSLLARNRVIAG